MKSSYTHVFLNAAESYLIKACIDTNIDGSSAAEKVGDAFKLK